MQQYLLQAAAEDQGLRLDLFILHFCQGNNLGLSRTSIQKLIAEGKVSLKNLSLNKSSYKIKAGDCIKFYLQPKEESFIQPEDIALEVVYEDRDLAVINKPRGLVVHPAPGNYTHTLVNALLHRFKKLSNINPARPGIVHRLDKETSGLLLIAKNNPSHLDLARQFAKHSIKRKYAALVKGRLEFKEDIIEASITRHPRQRKNMAVGFDSKAKYARTHYRTLKRSKDFSFLELEPFTGRTHQLRVHLAFIGHPILGDTKYGRDNEFERLALHAKYIGFIHPRSGKFMEFSSDLPPEFTRFLRDK